jgi:RNA polymerase sigma factor (TIGR02999 family)
MGDITHILKSMDGGNPQAADELIPLVYAELRHIAAQRMALQQPGQTLQPTALVHEAWLKLVGSGPHNWQSRRHFLNAAAEAMRHILVDTARRKSAVRNGGGLHRVELSEFDIELPDDADRFLKLHEAIDRLAVEHPRKAEIVKLKYFVGLDNDEIASTLGIPLRTLERQWNFARAWLQTSIETPRKA